MWDGSKPENRGSGSRGREEMQRDGRKGLHEAVEKRTPGMDRAGRQSRCIGNWLSRNTIDESYRRRTEQPIEVEPNLAYPETVSVQNYHLPLSKEVAKKRFRRICITISREQPRKKSRAQSRDYPLSIYVITHSTLELYRCPSSVDRSQD
ncbi:Uncharacterized protein DBV15_10394 [Temnothorax longispinosus]|uniref:Uncharacterized protein n=1 Tax=Temnothorax longispinosus TaxID=300112 RepID=A0A4S2L4Q8_9HYME|nr:Uncharacterized protein DBV15_10394 [Temnothorax longispinosus]